MSRQRYTEEFKIEAVKQVTELGHPVAEVAALGSNGYGTSSSKLLALPWVTSSQCTALTGCPLLLGKIIL